MMSAAEFGSRRPAVALNGVDALTPDPEDRLKAILQAERTPRVGSWEWDLCTGQVRSSLEMRRIWGLEHERILSPERLAELVHPDDRARVVAERERTLEQGEGCRLEYRLRAPDGTEHLMLEHAQVIEDDSGAHVRLLGTVQDVTIRKRAELELKASLQEKEVLLQEIHHRVKNNLQVVSSLLLLQATESRSSTVRYALNQSHKRVQAIAHIHELLYQSPDFRQIDFADYASRLARLLAGPEGRAHAVRIEHEVTAAPLELGTAVPCGLITAELVTNAVNHAFVGRRQGTITVRLSEHGNDRILEVEDDGVGIPDAALRGEPTGLGLRLVHALTEQLGGHLDIERNGGSLFRVRFEKG
ncbi:MAG: sensor histidine kinase [Myxococcota bacterium]